MMKPILNIILSPSNTARTMFTILLLLVFRLPFFALPVLPHYIELNPGVGFLAVFAGFWGWPVVIGSFIATLLGDALQGMLTGFSWFKATGTLVMTATFSVVWHRTRHSDSPLSEPLKWSVAGLLSVLVYAAWVGWGAEANMLYPFAYAAFIAAAHHAFFLMTFGLFAFCKMRSAFPHPEKGQALLQKRWAGAIALSGLGACLSGWLAENNYYQRDLFDAHVLGEHNGPLVEVFVILFLLLNIVGLIVAGVKRSADFQVRKK